MKHTLILILLFLAGVSHASILELVDQLGSTNLAVQTEAQATLFSVCSNAGRPGAEAERKAICEEICAVLKKGCPTPVATQLVRNLQRIGGEESVAMLASMLGSADEHLRGDVQKALVVNPSPKAGKTLQAQLKMRKVREPRWTEGLVIALGERGDAGTSKMIIPYLDSTDPLVFAATVKALGRMDEVEGIKALLHLRAKADGVRKSMLDSALFEVDRKEIFEKLYAGNEPDGIRAVALLGLVLMNGNNVAADAMASGNPTFQSAVIEAASQKRNKKLFDVLATNLDSLPPYLQVQAMGVLEFSDTRSYAKGIEPILLVEDSARKDAAAQALARIGTADSVPALLSSGTLESRKALGLLNADGVDGILEREALDKADGARRSVAIDALALRGRRDLIPMFFALAEEADELVSKSAVVALGLIGELSNLELLTKLMLAKETSPVSRDILKAIVEVMRRSSQPQMAVEILVAQMEGASLRGQALILQALAQVGGNEALQPVLVACKSTDEKLQKQAVKLLGEWKNDAALPAMLELAADESLSLPNHVVLMRGVSRLLAKQRKLKEPLAIQSLETCRRAEEKILIIPTLGKGKSPEAKAALKACLSDPELKVAAEEALAGKKQGGGKKGKKKK